ncbi:MAG: universal stress protein [Dehalococcoidia bacterium]
MIFLVAYDGSEGARRAATEVAPIARAAGASLVLLHVLDKRVAAADVTAAHNADAMEVATARALEEMQTFAADLGEDVRTRVEEQERGEDPSEAILRIAREEDATAIAISTRRATGLSGFFLGSVAQEVIKDAQRPVIVVKA